MWKIFRKSWYKLIKTDFSNYHKVNKYLLPIKDIYGKNKLYEDLYWKGKLLVFTWHFKKEFEELQKPIYYIINILDKGEHILISNKEKKYNVLFPWGKRYLCLSYVEHENIILIHIKPTTKKQKVNQKWRNSWKNVTNVIQK